MPHFWHFPTHPFHMHSSRTPPLPFMGAVLQQRIKNAWQPLAFFSKELSPAQKKYRHTIEKYLSSTRP